MDERKAAQRERDQRLREQVVEAIGRAKQFASRLDTLETGLRVLAARQARRDGLIEQLHNRLDRMAQQMEDLVLAIPGGPVVFSVDPQLTTRQRQVAVLLARGYTIRQVSEELVISHSAVRSHLSNIYRKLNVRDRIAMVRKMYGAGLLPEREPAGGHEAGDQDA